MDFSVLLENVLDSSHVPFTHHKSMSNRNVINTYDVKLLEGVSIAGFSGNWGAGRGIGGVVAVCFVCRAEGLSSCGLWECGDAQRKSACRCGACVGCASSMQARDAKRTLIVCWRYCMPMRAGPRGGTLGPQSTEFRPPGYMKHKLQVRCAGGSRALTASVGLLLSVVAAICLSLTC